MSEVIHHVRLAIEEGSQEEVQAFMVQLEGDEQRRVFSNLSAEEREQLAEMLPPEMTADLLEHVAEVEGVALLQDLPAELAADVVEELPAELGGDLLRELDEEVSEAILEEVEDEAEGDELRRRRSYAEDTAGALMSDHVLAFSEGKRVGDVLRDLEEHREDYSDAEVQYFYVVDKGGRLTGVLALRDLVLNKRSLPLRDLMQDPVSILYSADLEALEDVFEQRPFLGLPVVDEGKVLLGLVTRHAVEEALSEELAEDYMMAQGIIGGEELRSMPLKQRCLRRLAWLGPNILLNLLAASVIASYEETLQALIALAVFLPMVSDMSGCSGNQAVAVSIRELTLGILKPRDFWRVMRKEALVGFLNGLLLGIVLGTLAALWKGNVMLGLVIGSALAINTVVSVLIGGLVPLLLKKLKADPALASGPILTTCTDMCGFFLVLNLANLGMKYLVV